MSQSKTFVQTKKITPAFISSIMIIVAFSFFNVIIFDNVNCLAGNLYYICIQKLHEMKNVANLLLWMTAGTVVLFYVIVIVNDVKNARAKT